METFIARKIEEAEQKREGTGKDKYKAYFVKTKLYQNWRNDTDTILETDGYSNCIVRD